MRTCTYTIGLALCALGAIACQRGEQGATVAETVKPAETVQTEVAGVIAKTDLETQARKVGARIAGKT
jgi:hypothetical protein